MGADQGLTRLFYDGGCGLCDAAVRFVARRDRTGTLRFAPLGGATFSRMVPPEVRAALPDSLVVLTPEGTLLIRSAAVIHLLRRLGGGWGLAGATLAWVPAPLREGLYRLTARLRARRRACPRVDGAGDDRFDP